MCLTDSVGDGDLKGVDGRIVIDGRDGDEGAFVACVDQIRVVGEW